MKATLNLIALRLWYVLKREEAQDLIEYALLVGFISLAVVASIAPIGGYVYKYYEIIRNNVNKINP